MAARFKDIGLANPGCVDVNAFVQSICWADWLAFHAQFAWRHGGINKRGSTLGSKAGVKPDAAMRAYGGAFATANALALKIIFRNRARWPEGICKKFT